MLVLTEIKIANIHGKNELLSSQQFTRPPIGTTDDANMARPNMNPGAINYNALDAQGREKIKALITAQDPRLVAQVRAASQETIRQGLYTNLWQILLNNPKMTATEALIRSGEKGELLGPIGSNMETGLAMLTEAELTILAGKGAWAPGAILEPPASDQPRQVRPQFNSPLSRLRRNSELLGMRQVFEYAGIMAQAGKAEVLDKIDADKSIDLVQEITGAPRSMFHDDDTIKQIREQRAQQQQVAAMAAQAKAAGEAANEALPALDSARRMMEGQPLDA